MVGANWRAWRAWLILPLFMIAGCRGLWGQPGLPKDPLFARHQPIRGNATSAAPIGVAAVEPPSKPLEIANRPAYAKRQPQPLPLLPLGERDEGPMLVAPLGSVPGILTNRRAPGEPTTAVPTPP
jgi:hypothetical protein